MVFSVSLGAAYTGYESGIACGILLYIEKDYPDITIQQKSNFVSFLVFGGIFGAFIAGSVAEKIGRKLTIIISILVMIIANVNLVVLQDIDLLGIMKILQGLGCGINMMIGQVYISETTPMIARGSAVLSYILIIFFGFILAHVSSLINAYKIKLILSLGLFPSILSFLLFITTQKESPTYVAQKGTPEQVFTILRKFYNIGHQDGQKALEGQYNEITEQLLLSKTSSDKSLVELYKELFSNYGWNLFLAFTLHFLQNLTGFNLIQNFGPAILKDAGMAGGSNESLLYSMLYLTSIIFVFTFIGVNLSNKYGRRQLMLVTTIPLGFSLILLCGALGLSIITDGESKFAAWLCIISLSLYLMIFCVGYASVPWSVQTEIFPMHLRGIANAMCTTSNWVSNCLLLMVFLQVTKTETGKIISYSILASACFVSFFFVYRFLPETKDKPLDVCVRQIILARKQGCKNLDDTKSSGLLNQKLDDHIQLIQKSPSSAATLKENDNQL